MLYLLKMKEINHNLKPSQVEDCVQKIFYLSNKNKYVNVQVKNLFESFLGLSKSDMLVLKTF